MIAKIWSRDSRQTIKSCAGVLLIGTTVAVAMAVIRLIGERNLQRFLNKLIRVKHRPQAENLAADFFVSDNKP